MKKNKILSMNFLALMCLSIFMGIFSIDNVNAKTYDLSKKTTNNEVSTRELAMLASLVYENVPNDYAYTTSSGNGCLDKNGNLKNKECFYTFNGNKTYQLKGHKGENVYQYIEGMSNRKLNCIVSGATKAFSEPGEKYYFLNFAHTKEMEERGWTIFDYDTKDTIEITKKEIQDYFPNAVNFEGVFDAVTFRRGNNFVIAFRGTDYPDLLEWIEDVAYIVDGQHAEAAMAYYYAQKVYTEILEATNNDPNTKIYVTGHSLGAYLAQIGGAAIIDKEAGITYKKLDVFNNPKKYDNYASMAQDYSKGQSHLEQVAYFNGMGVGGLLMSSKLTRQVQNSLIYLSTHDKNGNLVNSNNKVNYSDNVSSSGRLVLYSMDSDPVSSIGLHYGEIYKLEVGADAITNHRETHKSGLGTVIQALAKNYDEIKEYIDLLNIFDKKEKDSYYTDSANALESLIYGVDNIKSGTFDAIPDLVSNQIASENPGVNIKNYSLGSILENLTNDVESFDQRYSITNIFDHFNANHETDSFVCIMDSGLSDNGTKYTNGDIEKIDIKVYSTGINCNNGVCSTNKNYDDKGFTFSHKTVTEKYKGNNIVLEALVDNACAKEYTWYYSTSQNGQYNVLGTTTDNKIIIPKSLFNNNGTKTYFFKVSATYGDTYTILKSTYKQGEKYIEYARTTAYSGNPTLNDGINDALVAKSSTMSNAIKVSLTVDTVAPTCKFKNSTENVKLSCKLFGLICSSKTVYPELVCTDSGTGVNKSSLKITTKKYETGLISSLKITNKYSGDKNVTGGFSRGIGITATRVPTSKTPYIRVTGEVSDNAGNKAKIDTKVSFKIKK